MMVLQFNLQGQLEPRTVQLYQTEPEALAALWQLKQQAEHQGATVTGDPPRVQIDGPDGHGVVYVYRLDLRAWTSILQLLQEVRRGVIDD